MADNVEANSGSGGATFRTDDDGTAHWPYVKIAFGADNTQTLVTASAGLPSVLLAGSAAIGKLAANSGVDIGDVDVLSLPSLAAGTNGIGKLTANSGVDIGDVDVTSVVPGVAATNLGKAEDAAHTTGDTGVMALAVRNDVLAALAGTDGDYAPVQVDAAGAVFTTPVPNATHGHSFYLNQDTSAVDAVKASPGTVYWIACMSTDATPVYLNLYDVASGSVTLGTTTPDLQFIVPSQGDANGAGFTINFGPHGAQFGTAITVAAATTFDGATDPGTNVVITNIGYE